MQVFKLYKPPIINPDNYRGRQLTYFKRGVKRYIAITYNIPNKCLNISDFRGITTTIYHQKSSIKLRDIK
ncbi:MAG: hypothetical protein ACRCX2_04555 [Paraclostridium sp.]